MDPNCSEALAAHPARSLTMQMYHLLWLNSCPSCTWLLQSWSGRTGWQKLLDMFHSGEECSMCRTGGAIDDWCKMCKNIPPGRKWNVAVCSFCILGIPRDSVFFHINSRYWFCKLLHPAGGLLFLVFLAQRQANFQKNSYPPVGPFFNWICLCLQRRWNFTRWFLLCHILATCVPQSENIIIPTHPHPSVA